MDRLSSFPSRKNLSDLTPESAHQSNFAQSMSSISTMTKLVKAKTHNLKEGNLQDRIF
jgi:hypothetical protein